MAEKITPRATDYSQWYVDIVLNAKLADYSPVKGCMVIRPRGYALWERIQQTVDRMFKDTGHSNAYFPLLIPESFLKKEAEHVEGFSPELAVVTIGGGENLEERLVIRPTSETIIWSMYKKWIQSYRDLPILINQWANVVRWEKRTRLFLRTTEFLWQEGHTAHATAAEAQEETLRILEIYRRFAEEYLAIPVLTGMKSESEKFAGAVRTYCIEALMQDGKSLQAGTSHDLGQNFAKAFDVTFQNRNKELEHVWATSWGISTRLVGALIMTHSDDKGLVVPPKVAPIEVAIVPIFKNETKDKVLSFVRSLRDRLAPRFRTLLDDDDQNSPGWKFAELELQGVPLRVEVGPKDLEKNQVTIARRDTGEKLPVPASEVEDRVASLLADIQDNLYQRALENRKSHTTRVETWDQFKSVIEDQGGFLEAAWCGDAACEAKVKEETKATIRLLPFAAGSVTEAASTAAPGTAPATLAAKPGCACVHCGKPARLTAMFARAY